MDLLGLYPGDAWYPALAADLAGDIVLYLGGEMGQRRRRKSQITKTKKSKKCCGDMEDEVRANGVIG